MPHAKNQRVRFGKEDQRCEREMTFDAKHEKIVASDTKACDDVEQGTGIEPASSAWEADVLPMY